MKLKVFWHGTVEENDEKLEKEVNAFLKDKTVWGVVAANDPDTGMHLYVFYEEAKA